MSSAQGKSKQTDTHRMQFEFSDDAYERLIRIKTLTGAKSYAELIRNSLRLYEWVSQQQSEGYELGLVKDDNLVKAVRFVF